MAKARTYTRELAGQLRRDENRLRAGLLVDAPGWPEFGSRARLEGARGRLVAAGVIQACRRCGRPTAGAEPGPDGWVSCGACPDGLDRAASVAGVDLASVAEAHQVTVEALRRALADYQLPRYEYVDGAAPARPVAAWSHLAAAVIEGDLRPAVSSSGEFSGRWVRGRLEPFPKWFGARVRVEALLLPKSPPSGVEACFCCGVDRGLWRQDDRGRWSCGEPACHVQEARPWFRAARLLADRLWGEARSGLAGEFVTAEDYRVGLQRGCTPVMWGEFAEGERPAPSARRWSWVTPRMLDAWRALLDELDQRRTGEWQAARREQAAQAAEAARIEALVAAKVEQMVGGRLPPTAAHVRGPVEVGGGGRRNR